MIADIAVARNERERPRITRRKGVIRPPLIVREYDVRRVRRQNILYRERRISDDNARGERAVDRDAVHHAIRSDARIAGAASVPARAAIVRIGRSIDARVAAVGVRRGAAIALRRSSAVEHIEQGGVAGLRRGTPVRIAALRLARRSGAGQFA